MLVHPPYSPDLNLAENAHADIKRTACVARCFTNAELQAALTQSWKSYSEEYFQQTYVKNYRNRLKDCVASEGDQQSTKKPPDQL